MAEDNSVELPIEFEDFASYVVEKNARDADPQTPEGIVCILRYQFGPRWKQIVTEAVNLHNAQAFTESASRKGKPFLIRSDTWKTTNHHCGDPGRTPKMDSDEAQRRAARKAERHRIHRETKRRRRREMIARNRKAEAEAYSRGEL